MAPGVSTIAVPRQLLRGQRRPRVALVGRVRTGKSSLFLAASSSSPQQEKLLHDGETCEECVVEVGLEQISLVDLPSLGSLYALSPRDRVLVKYLLWGNRWPPVAAHETEQPVAIVVRPGFLAKRGEEHRPCRGQQHASTVRRRVRLAQKLASAIEDGDVDVARASVPVCREADEDLARVVVLHRFQSIAQFLACRVRARPA